MAKKREKVFVNVVFNRVWLAGYFAGMATCHAAGDWKSLSTYLTTILKGELRDVAPECTIVVRVRKSDFYTGVVDPYYSKIYGEQGRTLSKGAHARKLKIQTELSVQELFNDYEGIIWT